MNHTIIISKGDITMRQGKNRDIDIYRNNQFLVHLYNCNRRLTKQTFDYYLDIFEEYGLDGETYVRVQG